MATVRYLVNDIDESLPHAAQDSGAIGQPRISTCDSFELIGAGWLPLRDRKKKPKSCHSP